MFADLQMLVPGLSIVRIVSNRHSTGNQVGGQDYVCNCQVFIYLCVYLR